MSRKYPHAGLTEELVQRLVSEYNALRQEYKRGFNEHIRKIKNCDIRVVQAVLRGNRIHARILRQESYNPHHGADGLLKRRSSKTHR